MVPRILIAAAALLAVLASALAWAGAHDRASTESERPGPVLSVTESTSPVQRSYTRTVHNDGPTEMRVHARFVFNVSVVRGNDASAVDVVSLLYLDDERVAGLGEETFAFEPAGDYARDRLQADFTVPPGGSRQLRAEVTLTPLGPPGASPWRIDYDPMDLQVTTSQAAVAPGVAIAGTVALAGGAVACAMAHPRVRGRLGR